MKKLSYGLVILTSVFLLSTVIGCQEDPYKTVKPEQNEEEENNEEDSNDSNTAFSLRVSKDTVEIGEEIEFKVETQQVDTGLYIDTDIDTISISKSKTYTYDTTGNFTAKLNSSRDSLLDSLDILVFRPKKIFLKRTFSSDSGKIYEVWFPKSYLNKDPENVEGEWRIMGDSTSWNPQPFDEIEKKFLVYHMKEGSKSRWNYKKGDEWATPTESPFWKENEDGNYSFYIEAANEEINSY